MRAAIPFLVPSRVERSRCLEPLVRISRCWLYLGHSLRMWLLDSLAELSHGQVVGSVERGRKVWRNSPVYECPVRHWINRPNSSRLLLRLRKWLVGVSDGLSLLAMAKRPSLGELDHSFCQIFPMVLLALLLALDRVVLNGIWHSSFVASLASASALSLPGMSQWLGHQASEIERLVFVSSICVTCLWKFSAKCCAELGLGSAVARMAAALSEKIAM